MIVFKYICNVKLNFFWVVIKKWFYIYIVIFVLEGIYIYKFSEYVILFCCFSYIL